MIGTKTSFITLIITIIMSFIYLVIYSIKKKTYKNLIKISLITIIGIVGISLIIPKTNFYKNIEIHLDYLKVDKVTDIFKDEKLIDHFIFSQRLTFLNDKAKIYSNANNYQRLFGLGSIILYTNAESGFGNGICINDLSNSEEIYKKIKEIIEI
jgi:hypothetical protein